MRDRANARAPPPSGQEDEEQVEDRSKTEEEVEEDGKTETEEEAEEDGKDASKPGCVHVDVIWRLRLTHQPQLRVSLCGDTGV